MRDGLSIDSWGREITLRFGFPIVFSVTSVSHNAASAANWRNWNGFLHLCYFSWLPFILFSPSPFLWKGMSCIQGCSRSIMYRMFLSANCFQLPFRFLDRLHKIQTSLLLFLGSVAVIVVSATSGASNIARNSYIQCVRNLITHFKLYSCYWL